MLLVCPLLREPHLPATEMGTLLKRKSRQSTLMAGTKPILFDPVEAKLILSMLSSTPGAL